MDLLDGHVRITGQLVCKDASEAERVARGFHGASGAHGDERVVTRDAGH